MKYYFHLINGDGGYFSQTTLHLEFFTGEFLGGVDIGQGVGGKLTDPHR